MAQRHHPDTRLAAGPVSGLRVREPDPRSPVATSGKERSLELWARRRYWVYHCKAECDLEFAVYSWFNDLNPEAWRCPIHGDPVLIVHCQERQGFIFEQAKGTIIYINR